MNTPRDRLRLLRSDILYQGRVISLVVDQLEYPSGTKTVREVARHPGGAVAVPILDDGRVVLVSQLRYPLGKPILELPAGKLSVGEDPRDCAARELEEETGWVADRWEKLTSIYSSPGFCDEELHIFLATGLKETPNGHQRSEGEEGMTVHLPLLKEAVRMVERGEIRDAKTICGLLLTNNRMRGKTDG
jgi:ADP-ribose pyrophosphatase